MKDIRRPCMCIYIYVYLCTVPLCGDDSGSVWWVGVVTQNAYIVISTRFFCLMFLGTRFENKKCVKPVWVVIVKKSRDLLSFCTIDWVAGDFWIQFEFLECVKIKHIEFRVELRNRARMRAHQPRAKLQRRQFWRNASGTDATMTTPIEAASSVSRARVLWLASYRRMYTRYNIIVPSRGCVRSFIVSYID